MNEEIQNINDRLSKIEEKLNYFIKPDRYLFQRDIEFFNGKKIKVGLSLGTSIGTAITQKISAYGVTPVVQAGAITTPSAPSAAYVQAEAQSMKTAVDAIRVAIKNFGITA